MVDTISVSFQIDRDNINLSLFDKSLFVSHDGFQSEKVFLNKTFNYDIKLNDCVGKDVFDSVKVVGSLTKGIAGNNFINYAFKKNDIKKFVEIIEDETKLKLMDLKKIGRLDIGINLNLNPQLIINKMDGIFPARMSKHLFNSTVQFRNKQRQLVIYDKVREVKSVGNITEQMREYLLDHEQITRIEERTFRTKNIHKQQIRTLEDVFDFKKQSSIFLSSVDNIFKTDLLMNNVKKGLRQSRILAEAIGAIQEFGNLENYRKHLIKDCGTARQNASRIISELKTAILLSKKEDLISLNESIKKEIDRMKAEIED